MVPFNRAPIYVQPSGLLVVTSGPTTATCGTPMNGQLDAEFFAIGEEALQHMVDVVERIRVMATTTLERSIHKRVLLYEAVLLNDSIGTVFLLASHGGLRMGLPLTRMSYEYVTRAIYYAQRKNLALEHIRALWPKMDKLFSGGVEHDMSSPEVRAKIDQSVSEFMAKNPNWTRPHDSDLRPIMVEMYGEMRAKRLYDRWHIFPSPFVHGTFDGVGLVLGHDGNNTIVKPGADIVNTEIAELTRFAFAMTALQKREFGIDDPKTLPLFRRYIARRDKLRIKVRSPFPLPTAKFRKKT